MTNTYSCLITELSFKNSVASLSMIVLLKQNHVYRYPAYKVITFDLSETELILYKKFCRKIFFLDIKLYINYLLFFRVGAPDERLITLPV